jgi:hypothetical protein
MSLREQLKSLMANPIDEDGTFLDQNGSLFLKTNCPSGARVVARVPVEGCALDADGSMIHYLVFVDSDGFLDQLDIYKDDLSVVVRHAEPKDLRIIIADS